MADNSGPAARQRMLEDVNKRILEHVLNDKPIDASLLALRDQLNAEVAGDDGFAVNVYEAPITPFGADL